MNLALSRTAIVLVAVALATAVVGAAIGASTVVADTNTVRLRIVQSDFEDGFDTGWHTHPGLVVVQVQKGFLKIYQGKCGRPSVVGPSGTYVEVPLVPVRAVAHGHTQWTTTLILPNAVGDPTQTSVPDPCSS